MWQGKCARSLKPTWYFSLSRSLSAIIPSANELSGQVNLGLVLEEFIAKPDISQAQHHLDHAVKRTN